MNLYIAEKPSLGRAIADVMPRPHQRGDGYIKVANGDCVSWCIGHLLEQAEPHAYDPAFKSWRAEHLPITPDKWKLVPKSDTRNQLSVLRKLVADATGLIHAGDPDREGQLLVDQLFVYLRVSAKRRATIKRLLVNDLNPSAVKRALNRLDDNRSFGALSASALARSRADWLYGINMTRAYTIRGRKVGYDGVLSVGRVQTPVLGLVVRRCDQIDNFVSKPFYEVVAKLRTQDNQQFSATWQPSEACRPYMDDANHVLVRKLAENVVSRIIDKPAQVKKYTSKNKRQPPPLPYSLSALQIDASRRFGLSAQNTLSACQELYERHKLVTYPRSDNRYLPTEHWSEAATVLAAISHTAATLASGVQGADTKLKSAAWNDSKVEAHHAIIPTTRKLAANSLSRDQQNVYELVARQYVAQFYPAHEYADAKAEIIIEGGLFTSNAKTILKPGWKALFPSAKSSSKATPGKDGNNKNADAEHAIKNPQTSSAAASSAYLPLLKKDQLLHCLDGECIEKNTTPPPYFTDATLLSAMTGIARYVQSAELRKILKDTDGLGTEATRAGIIELLFRRGFMIRKAKQIHASDAGRGLIRSLPESATLPDMTAHWESTLTDISQRNANYDDFMQPLLEQLNNLVRESNTVTPTALQGVSAPATNSKKNFKKRAKKKTAQRKKRPS